MSPWMFSLILGITALVASLYLLIRRLVWAPCPGRTDQKPDTEQVVTFDAEAKCLRRALENGRWGDSGRWRVLGVGPGFKSTVAAFDRVRGVFLLWDTKTQSREVVMWTSDSSAIKNSLIWCGDYPSLLSLGGTQRANSSREEALATAERVFSTVTALLPRRLCNEEIGDALEDIHARLKSGHPLWQIWLKVASTVFWVVLHAGIEVIAKVASALKITTGGDAP